MTHSVHMLRATTNDMLHLYIYAEGTLTPAKISFLFFFPPLTSKCGCSHIYTYVYIHTYICVHVYRKMRVGWLLKEQNMYAYVCVFLHLRTYTYAHIDIYRQIHTCIHIYIHTNTYESVNTYTHIHTLFALQE